MEIDITKMLFDTQNIGNNLLFFLIKKIILPHQHRKVNIKQKFYNENNSQN